MKTGNLKFFLISPFFLLLSEISWSQEKINLSDIQPSFEEESELQETDQNIKSSNIKSKTQQKVKTNEIIVKLRALDKITAKTSDINIKLGNKEKFGYLEILPKKCSKSSEESDKGVAAYIQVKDLSDKKDDKIFVFNGWTFSYANTLRTFDHPVYDLWVVTCENI